MPIITIPKKMAAADDLVILSRREYKALAARKNVEEFTPTKAQQRALEKAEENLRRGKTLPYREAAQRLGIGD